MNRRSEGDVGYRFSCGLGGTDVFNFDIKTWEGRKKREKVGGRGAAGSGMDCRLEKHAAAPRDRVCTHIHLHMRTNIQSCKQQRNRLDNRP